MFRRSTDVALHTAVAQTERKARGLVLGRSFDLRPPPPSADVLASPLSLNDVRPIAIPRRDVRARLQQMLHVTGLRSLPRNVDLSWQARAHIHWLQASLLPKVGGRGAAITHPMQLMQPIDFLMGLPRQLDVEQRLISLLIGRALLEYRKRISQGRQKPFLYTRAAAAHFASGFQSQQRLSSRIGPDEKFQLVAHAYNSYYYSRIYYVSTVITQEPSDPKNKLFSKFLRALFFMASVEADGTLAARPSYRRLPPREHVVHLAKRDAALQTRLTEDEALRAEMQSMIKTFRPLGHSA